MSEPVRKTPKQIEDDMDQWDADQYRLDLETYHKFNNTIDHIVRECHFQAHLHGEIEPTPYGYVAREAFFKGFVLGRNMGHDDLIDALNLREDYDRAVKEEEIKQERERIEEIKQRFLKKKEEREENENLG